MLNFSNFKPVLKANEGKKSTAGVALGQNFEFKFKKSYIKVKGTGEQGIGIAFTISNKKFEALDLDNKGLLEAVFEGKSYLAVVANEHAIFMKRNGKNEKGVKGKSFKSTILEAALAEQGVINADAIGVTQKLLLTLVAGSETAVLGEGDSAIPTFGVYEITKDETALTEDEKAADDKNEVDETPEVDNTVVPEVPAASNDSTTVDTPPLQAYLDEEANNTEAASPIVDETATTSTESAPADDDF